MNVIQRFPRTFNHFFNGTIMNQRAVQGPVHATFLLMLSGMLVSLGCSKEEDPTLPVYGTVLFQGQPLKSGDIEFGSPDRGGLRRGALIANGAYRTAPFQGLEPGKYIVRIFSVPSNDTSGNEANATPLPGDEKLGPKGNRDLIPPQYNMRSKLEVTVVSGQENRFDFELTTK